MSHRTPDPAEPTSQPAHRRHRPRSRQAHRDPARRGARFKLWAGRVCTALVVVPVALAGLLPLPGANAQDLSRRRLPPLTEGHLFGTDQLGRDLLSRVLHGGQVSLTVGVLAVLVSGLIGIAAGSAAGYFGGWVDALVSRLLEAQLALPLLMMLLLVVALFGPSVTVITCVIAIAQWPEVARLTRSLVLVEREKPYVAAARVLGLRTGRILARHIIPNIVRQATPGRPAAARPGGAAGERAELPRRRARSGRSPPGDGSSPTARTTSPPRGGW